MKNTRLNMFLFRYDHLAKGMHETSANPTVKSDGSITNGYKVKGRIYYQPFDFNMIVLVYII